jgi:hypothetical protein
LIGDPERSADLNNRSATTFGVDDPLTTKSL